MNDPKPIEAEVVGPSRAVDVRRPAPSVADMLQTVVEKGITSDNVGAFEQLVKLYEHMQDRDAEREFARAFVALQGEMPKVQATKAVPNNDGGVRYRFAPFEDIMRQVGPMLQRHGFTVSFSMRVEQTRLIQTCTLQHSGGHKKANDFAVRIGSGPPKASESQADGAAATYAKRFALTDCLNIVVEHMDNDAAVEGGSITAEQAASLRKRVADTGSDQKAFLRFAGADKFEDIPAAKYSILDENLRRKETTK